MEDDNLDMDADEAFDLVNNNIVFLCIAHVAGIPPSTHYPAHPQ